MGWIRVWFRARVLGLGVFAVRCSASAFDAATKPGKSSGQRHTPIRPVATDRPLRSRQCQLHHLSVLNTTGQGKGSRGCHCHVANHHQPSSRYRCRRSHLLSLSRNQGNDGLGFGVEKEVGRQRGSGERGSLVREIESREEMRDPSETPFCFN